MPGIFDNIEQPLLPSAGSAARTRNGWILWLTKGVPGDVE